jgi:hypothetical protein
MVLFGCNAAHPMLGAGARQGIASGNTAITCFNANPRASCMACHSGEQVIKTHGYLYLYNYGPGFQATLLFTPHGAAQEATQALQHISTLGMARPPQSRLTVHIPDILIHFSCSRTRIHLLHTLRLHRRALDKAFLVHDLLQRVVFPAKEVITVVCITRMVAKRIHKRLASILRPQRKIVECLGLVDDLKHDLRHAHGVRNWAGALGLKGAARGVGLVLVSKTP